jgi:hypothetical protein
VAGSNGDGYGALLAFGADGSLIGAAVEDSRIDDPRGLSVDRDGDLLLLNRAQPSTGRPDNAALRHTE